ncbi:transporter, major facilitator family protein [Necator americanus]|uniref:Transporter, major facilitator family protein n=1 Tax=Necator americanus TaxID=51031 RepID=W2T214_NECAM|nr:transporter, major facilitator family protein [Necator americanus]ETN75022.1 transporter, major facilitator family protein [Necator americanus]
MFCGVQFSIYFPTLWPFLNKVDPTASETFFGIITAAFSIGQGLASPLFGFWMNRSKSVRQPMICGIVVMIVSNIIFCFVEAFKEKERRWIMMISRFFIGLGAGTVGVMRAYASTASNLKDRARAITFIQASYVIGMTVGPGVPVAFTPIGFPGWAAGPLHFNMYTAPAWFACLVCIASLVLLIILLEENYAGLQTESGGRKDQLRFKSETISDDYNPLPKYDVFAVSVCVITQFTLMFIITNLETIGSMYAMAMWGWTTKETVVYIGILQAVNGAASVLVYAGFVVKLGDYVSGGRERVWTMIGLGLGLIYHIATFPYPVGSTLKWNPANTSDSGDENVGCDPSKYSWCNSVYEAHLQVNFWLYAVLYCTLLAACFPVVNVSMNTLFSKILGARRQGTMQGIMLMSGSLARTLGPLLVSWLFQTHGPIPVWGIELGTLGGALLLWLVLYRRLVPLKIPQLACGKSMKYANGTKYRM